ncbi:hypothetical protein AVEN_208786-1 [Araneus ventricosus]|uniref:Uncharacterized protein n=1 Tax=Araneus ventricosus TaxID=182803 RepID=A0A4Y2QFI9_ARAVE|nr:hypothetical protein AVEN_208786-1 [Araneus ventricosus]
MRIILWDGKRTQTLKDLVLALLKVEHHQLIQILYLDILSANQALPDAQAKRGNRILSTPLPRKFRGNGEQQQEEHPSVNGTNLYKNQEVASGFSIVPPISQMMPAEPHDISSQAASDNNICVVSQ